MIDRVLRFTGAVLLTTGALLLIDGVLTVAWEEPLTSFVAARRQAALRDELARAEQATRSATSRGSAPAITSVLARRARENARAGHAIGRLQIPSIGVTVVMVEGIASADLTKGPGHYPTTPFPGESDRTVAIAGHRTTFGAPFRRIAQLQRGSRIVMQMPYARLTYEVTGRQVVTPSQTAVIRDTGQDRIVLTTCDPPFSASHRLVVFARRVRPDASG